VTLVYLGLGSNVGDRESILRAALSALETAGVRVLRRSSVYETEPVGLRDQPWFLNVVAEVQTACAPEPLLDLIQRIEASMGRTRTVRRGPRTLDIDILLYGDRAVTTTRLTVPHPELVSRRFVLEPLAELRPDLILPGGRTVADVLGTMPAEPVVRRVGALA
jgi:2-amino-4-hydroxy-6-hydroxymethyldihydropteridine diphosphokinase